MTPGTVCRSCPVCAIPVETRREPAGRGDPGEMVLYPRHRDGAKRSCRMSGKRAALAAVAFTGVSQ